MSRFFLKRGTTQGVTFTTTTSTGHDQNNIFANPSVGTNLQTVPVTFAQILTQQGFPLAQVATLIYTSLSLPFGGLFDVDSHGTGSIDHPWHLPHCGHRRGVEADVAIRNVVPPEQREALRRAILRSHFTMPVRTESPQFPGASHWHLSAR